MRNTKVRWTILTLGIAIAPLMLYWILYSVIEPQNFLETFKIWLVGIFTIAFFFGFAGIFACGAVGNSEQIDNSIMPIMFSFLIVSVFSLSYLSTPKNIEPLLEHTFLLIIMLGLVMIPVAMCGSAIAILRKKSYDDSPSFTEFLVGFMYALVISVVGGSGAFVLLNNITLFGITPWILSVVPTVLLVVVLLIVPTKRWKLV